MIRIHLGTEDQEPDSTIEIHEGAGNVPAYRGMCYLVFTDLQLADFSNRIPSISAEVVGNGTMACDAVILPAVPSMFRDGGVIDASEGTLFGFTAASTIYKYDLINNKLLLNVGFDADHDLYGDLYGLDPEGYLYHASDAYGVGMHLVKRHPETLAVMAKTKKRIEFSVSGRVQDDKILVYRSRKIYSTDFELLHDLSEVLTSHLDEAPLCEDGEGNIWQISASYAKKVSFNLFGVADVDVMDCAAYTGSQNPDAVFWDDTTGYLYFRFNGLERIVKWDINSGYVAHVDGVQFSNGYSIQEDRSYPQNGQLWTCDGPYMTLVNLATMRIEKECDLSAYMPTYDDFYICDGTGSINNDFLGDVRVDTLFPSGAGSAAELTPMGSANNWENVDDASPDEDTSYNASDTVGQKDSFSFSDLSTLDSSVFGVQANILARKDDAGTRLLRGLVRVDSSNFEGSDQSLGDSYSDFTQIWEQNPSTASAWTEAEVNAAEFGYKVES